MIWAVLALLGVPVWLVLGGLVGALFSRRRFKNQPGVVPLLFRQADGDKWPRRLAYGHLAVVVHSSIHVPPDS
jgi:hypothetical protein